MTRRSFTRLFSSRSEKPRRRAARAASLESLGGRRGRSLRFETVEQRLLLTHAAPVLNSADTAAFTSIQENVSVSANAGETVSDVLASGGAGFLTLDTANGAQEGIAVTGLAGTTDGVWEYSRNNGTNWSLFANDLSLSNALRLSGSSAEDDLIRFLPNANFSGVVSLQFHAWDQTDAAAAGSQQDLPLLGATGGSTAYGSASASATLAVTPTDVAPSFILMPSTTTPENNTVTASGGLPGGSNPNVISVLNFASSIVPG